MRRYCFLLQTLFEQQKIMLPLFMSSARVFSHCVCLNSVGWSQRWQRRQWPMAAARQAAQLAASLRHWPALAAIIRGNLPRPWVCTILLSNAMWRREETEASKYTESSLKISTVVSNWGMRYKYVESTFRVPSNSQGEYFPRVYD